MKNIAAFASILLAFGMSASLSYSMAPLVQPPRSRPPSASAGQISRRRSELLEEFLEEQEQKAKAGREDVMRRNGMKPFRFGIHTVWALNQASAEKKFTKNYQNPC